MRKSLKKALVWKKKRQYRHMGNPGKGAKKMAAILKKHSLTQLETSKLLKVSLGCVASWFHAGINVRQKYFDKLKSKGY